LLYLDRFPTVDLLAREFLLEVESPVTRRELSSKSSGTLFLILQFNLLSLVSRIRRDRRFRLVDDAA
jgi:hypothetical protein